MVDPSLLFTMVTNITGPLVSKLVCSPSSTLPFPRLPPPRCPTHQHHYHRHSSCIPRRFGTNVCSGNHLTIRRNQLTSSENPESDEWGHSFICRTCPYEFIVNKEYYNRRYSKVKEVDDIMGGAAAWQNVDQTTGILSFRRCCLRSPWASL
jgi:hypothetical protein